MGRLRSEIEMFLEKQARVYHADENRLVTDSRRAEGAAGDHIERWLWELVQNSDDAQATKVNVCFTDDAVYFADNGEGFKPGAVEAFSMTDFSNKTSGTIGRKGVGFKAVYTITQHPQIFTKDGEGIEFTRGKAAEWLEKQGFKATKVPYQWLPFFVSREDAERDDPRLAQLSSYTTVIKLPLAHKIGAPEVFPAYNLLPFRNLTMLEVTGASGSPIAKLSVERKRQGKASWTVDDSRSGQVVWCVCKPKPLTPPKSVVEALPEDESERVGRDGISFMVAAPADPAGVVCPTKDPMRVRVFYPADNDLSPVRMLLHAEFRVESTRKALMRIDKDPYNAWVATQLAQLIVDFVQGRYDRRWPHAYLRLLNPVEGFESHASAKLLWGMIKDRARKQLFLPDTSARLRLRLGKAQVLSVQAAPDKARSVLSKLPTGATLVHESIEHDDEALHALRSLGCHEITDEDVLAAIAGYAAKMSRDAEWLWACWEWAAAWAAAEPYRESHQARLNRIRELSIFPLQNRLRARADLPGTVTWRPSEPLGSLPGWMPLHFIDDWFRDRVVSLRDDSALRRLLKEIDVKAPNADLVKDAFGAAVRKYWNATEGEKNPKRFFVYLCRSGWESETSEAPPDIQGCPVLAKAEGTRGHRWVEARQAYLGAAWGENLIARLYRRVPGVLWVQPMTTRRKKERNLLQWLGCRRFPRVVVEKVGAKSSDIGLWELPKEYENWKAGFQQTIGCRYSITVTEVQKLDSIDVGSQGIVTATILLRLIAANWNYYGQYAQARVKWREGRKKYPNEDKCDSFWWYDLKHTLQPPIVKNHAETAPLKKCWLPEKTLRQVERFLPVIDANRFGADKERVVGLLTRDVVVRSRLAEMTPEEWSGLLASLPSLFPAEQCCEVATQAIVKTLYEACLSSLESIVTSDGYLKSVPLLCSRGKKWAYVTPETERWIAKEDIFSQAFSIDVWQLMLVRKQWMASAKKAFALSLLDPEVRLDYDGETDVPDIRKLLDQATPFLYAWRSNELGDEACEKLRSRLQNLELHGVRRLTAHLEAPCQGSGKLTERVATWKYGWEERDDGKTDLFIQENADDVAYYLAHALCGALGWPRQSRGFVETLLKRESADAMKRRLTHEGIPKVQIDTSILQFRDEGTDLVGEPRSPRGKQKRPEPKADQGQGVTTDEGQEGRLPKEYGAPDPSPPRNQPVHEATLNLKDPRSASYEVNTIGVPPVVARGMRTATGDGLGSGEAPLSEVSRADVEQCGRSVAEKVLRERGYSVEQKGKLHPGHDIEAMKNDTKILIEVKAHVGTARQVNLTSSEWEECRRFSETRGGESWQLWNIESLGRDCTDKIRITVFNAIPEEALRNREYTVDLSRCKPIAL